MNMDRTEHVRFKQKLVPLLAKQIRLADTVIFPVFLHLLKNSTNLWQNCVYKHYTTHFRLQISIAWHKKPHFKILETWIWHVLWHILRRLILLESTVILTLQCSVAEIIKTKHIPKEPPNLQFSEEVFWQLRNIADDRQSFRAIMGEWH